MFVFKPKSFFFWCFLSVLGLNSLAFALTDESQDGVIFPKINVVQAKKQQLKEITNTYFLHDIGNIAVIQFEGNYDINTANGEFNIGPRLAVTNTFYENHDDTYDFLVVFTEFEFNTGDFVAFYTHVFNEIKGIGQEPLNLRPLFGNSNKLQGYIDMTAWSRYALDPLQLGYDTTLDTLSHEIMHRWGDYISYQDISGNINTDFIGAGNAHWGEFVDSQASVMGGAYWHDNIDGTFIAKAVRQKYSDLDLYLAGMLPADEVNDLFYIADAKGDPETYWPLIGDVTSGTRTQVSIEQIIQAEGERIPNYLDAQKTFRIGFIVLVPFGNDLSQQIAQQIENFSSEFSTRFNTMTGGQGIIDPELVKESTLTTGTPILLDAGGTQNTNVDISTGVNWLLKQQKKDGHWEDKSITQIRDTAIALKTLSLLNITDLTIETIVVKNWLYNVQPKNQDDLAWQLASGVLSGSGKTVVNLLQKQQDKKGGWGLTLNVIPSPFDTAQILQALSQSGYAETESLERAQDYLLSTYKTGYGWGYQADGEPDVNATAVILESLLYLNTDPIKLKPQIDWLVSQQLPNGLFGNPLGSAHETARVINVLSQYPEPPTTNITLAIDALSALQLENGSWQNSVYVTANVLMALRQQQKPNLSLSAGIQVTPTEPINGEILEINFQVNNISLFNTKEVTANVYLGDPKKDGVLISEAVIIPLLSKGETFTGRFLWDTLGYSGEQNITIWIDSKDILEEASEQDNIQTITINIASTLQELDLMVIPNTLNFSPKIIHNLPLQITTDLAVRNLSTINVENVDIALQLSIEGGDFKTLNQQTLILSANETKTIHLSSKITESGSKLFRIFLDYNEKLTEVNEYNNEIKFSLDTKNSLDFVISDNDISLTSSSIIVGSDIDFSFKIHNIGTETSPLVTYDVGVRQGEQDYPIHSQQIQLTGGEVITRNVNWLAQGVGDAQFYVKIDINNEIPEINEDNNQATLDFTVASNEQPNLLVKHKEITFDSLPGLEGEILTVTLPIYNTSDIAVTDFSVILYQGIPEDGGQYLAQLDFTGLAANSSLNAKFITPPLNVSGNHLFYIKVDTKEQINEFLESDNIAFTRIDILSLADLAVAPGNISLTPRLPVVGEPLSVTVRINNLGQQSTDNVNISLFEVLDTGEEIKVATSVTLAQVKAGKIAFAQFNWTFAEQGTVIAIRVKLDPENKIIERIKNNNSADVLVNIQDRNFYTQYRYISPNGDGIQDTTEIFFALDTPKDIKIEIIDYNNEIIRLFNSNELKQIKEGSINWDGRNNQNLVVRDGTYSVRLMGLQDHLYGQLLVVVDTNHVPIFNAIKTNSFYQAYLNCSVQDIGVNPVFSADGQFLYTHKIKDLNGDNINGLFRISSRGKGVDKLLSTEWIAENMQSSSNLAFNNIYPLDDGRLVFGTLSLSSYNLGSVEQALWISASDFSIPRKLDIGESLSYQLLKVTSNYIYISLGKKYYKISLTLGVPPILLKTHDDYINFLGGSSSGWLGKVADASSLENNNLIFISSDPAQSAVILDIASENKNWFLSKDNQHLALLLKDNLTNTQQLKVYEIKNNQIILLYNLNYETNERINLSWSPNNQLAVLFNQQGKVELLDALGMVSKNIIFNKDLFDNYREQLELIETYSDFKAVYEFATWNDYENIIWNNTGDSFIVDYQYLLYCEKNCYINEVRKSILKVFQTRNHYNIGNTHMLGRLVFMVDVDKEIAQLLGEDVTSYPINSEEPIDFNTIDLPDITKYMPDFSPEILSWQARTEHLLGITNKAFYSAHGYRQYDVLQILDLQSNPINIDNINYGLFSGRWPKDNTLFTRKLYFKDYNYDLAHNINVSPCLVDGNPILRIIENSDNLMVHLELKNTGGLIEIKGVATDINFQNATLEWAYTNQPDTWFSIIPSLSEPVIDELFTTWVPPYADEYQIRLTVEDKAGNKESIIRSLDWFGNDATLASVQQDFIYVSPNGDNVQDEVTLSFKVLKPVNLDITIEDSTGFIIKTFTLVYPIATGKREKVAWDGRNEQGGVVADGEYLMRVQNRRFRIIVDTQLPILELSYEPVENHVNDPKNNLKLVDKYQLNIKIDEKNYQLSDADFSFQTNNGSWNNLVLSFNKSEKERKISVSQFNFINYPFRLILHDLAGNKAKVQSIRERNELLITSYDPIITDSISLTLGQQNDFIDTSIFLNKPINGDRLRKISDKIKLNIAYIDNKVVNKWVLEYLSITKDPFSSNWNKISVLEGGDRTTFTLDLNKLPLSGTFYIRIRADSLEYALYSNQIKIYFNPEALDYFESFFIRMEIENSSSSTSESRLGEAARKIFYQLIDKASFGNNKKVRFWVLESKQESPIIGRVTVTSSTDARYITPMSFSASTLIEQTKTSDHSGYFFDIPMLPCHVYNLKFKELSVLKYIKPCLKIELNIKPYIGLECAAKTTNMLLLKALIKNDSIRTSTQKISRLSIYSVLSNNKRVLLANIISPPIEKTFPLSIDTTNYPEGSYMVVAEAINKQGKILTTSTYSIPIDHTPAQSQITFPSAGEKICGVEQDDGDIKISIEGDVSDNFEAYYLASFNGYGAKPKIIIGGGPYKSNENDWGMKIKDSTSIFCLEETLQKGKIDKNCVSLPPLPPLPPLSHYFGELGGYLVKPKLEKTLKSGAITATIEAVDWSGASVCSKQEFYIDINVDINMNEEELIVFSPNNDTQFDKAKFSLFANESLIMSVEVYEKEIESGKIGDFLILLTENKRLNEHTTFEWDGMINNEALPDGEYIVVFTFTDDCGFTVKYNIPVEIDNTGPEIAINYPQSGDSLKAIIEVIGTFDDKNFANAKLEFAKDEEAQLDWQKLAIHKQPFVRNGIISHWLLNDISGDYLLRLTAKDTVHNQTEIIVNLTIDELTTLIWQLNAFPALFSPNGDHQQDTSKLTLGLTSEAEVTLSLDSMQGITLQNFMLNKTVSAGSYSYTWDGRDMQGQLVADGQYKLTADISEPNSLFSQKEQISLNVDNTPPVIEIINPLVVTKGEGPFSATVAEENLRDFKLWYINPETAENQLHIDVDREGNHQAGDLKQLKEGAQKLRIQSHDWAGNITEQIIDFIIDRTPPIVQLELETESLIGGIDKQVLIKGQVKDQQLAQYILEIRPEATDTWKVLYTQDQIPDTEELFNWEIKDPDGRYELRLKATDKAGWTSTTSIMIIIDTTAPIALIESPIINQLLGSNAKIKGTVEDANILFYRLQIRSKSAPLEQWQLIKQDIKNINKGLLYDWENITVMGKYILRLTVKDKVGLTTSTLVEIEIDAKPPIAPLNLTVKQVAEFSARLNWQKSISDDVIGYYIYRNNTLLNTQPIKVPTYKDEALADGQYNYQVTAIDIAGNQSIRSNKVKLIIDRTPPNVILLQPAENAWVKGIVNILGTAHSTNDFFEYRFYIRKQGETIPGNLLRRSPTPLLSEKIIDWNSQNASEGAIYIMRLEAEDTKGNTGYIERNIKVDNQAPAVPTGLTAVIQNIQDVITQWNANNESDLLGYLLYRDNQLINLIGSASTDLRLYALTENKKLDLNLGDGEHFYQIAAIDQAGNTSALSAKVTLNIETGPPHLNFKKPKSNQKFDTPLYILAVSEDLDITQVEFSYRLVSSNNWNTFFIDNQLPYETEFNAQKLNLVYGEIELKATATDFSGLIDPTPPVVNVKYHDITPPKVPTGLVTHVEGGEITITWNANTEDDLKGYQLYRQQTYQASELLTPEPITELTFTDTNKEDDNYQYQLVAVDKFDNSSKKTNAITAKVYSLTYQPIYTPTLLENTILNGVSPVIDKLKVTLNGIESNTPISNNGEFQRPLTLVLGKNELLFWVEDHLGNRSRQKQQIIYYTQIPKAPKNPNVIVTDKTIDFSWDAVPDLRGYQVYRQGKPIKKDKKIIDIASYSASSKNYMVNNVGNNDTNSYWVVYQSSYTKTAWIEVDFNNKKLISQLDIDWGADGYALDFEIQAWTGDVWLPITSVINNNSVNSSIILDQPYITDRLKLFIKKMDSKVLINTLTTYQKITQLPLQYTEIQTDGIFEYQVTAINSYGFESILSEKAIAEVGDIIAPPPVVLSGIKAANTTVELTWTESTATDLIAYHLYRNKKLILSQNKLDIRVYQDIDLLNGDYEYQLLAVDKVGNLSKSSNLINFKISTTLLPAPTALTLSSNTEGDAFLLNWQAIPDIISTYRLVRSETSEGVYHLIVDTQSLSYQDSEVVYGQTYFYKVYALDTLGNQGKASNKVTGTLVDSSPPDAPIIEYPVTSLESPFKTNKLVTDISGQAEPGSQVSLLLDSNIIAQTRALIEPEVTHFTLLGDYGKGTLSPDGNYLYLPSYPSEILDLKNNIIMAKLSIYHDDSTRVSWAKNSQSLFIWHSDFNNELRRFNLQGEQQETILKMNNLNIVLPSPANDLFLLTGQYQDTNQQLIEGVWIYQVATQNMVQIPDLTINNISQSSSTWSPDGKYIAYRHNTQKTLKILDINTLIDFTISETEVSNELPAWHPNGQKIIYSAMDNAGLNKQIWLFDVITKQNQVLTQDNNHSLPIWSPNGETLSYIEEDEGVWLVSQIDKTKQLVSLSTSDAYLTYWTNQYLIILKLNDYELIGSAGYFQFKEVILHSNSNQISALARDIAGNSSLPALPIEILVDIGDLPDLTILTNEFSVLPQVGSSKDLYQISLTVTNQGIITTQESDVKLIWVQPDGTQKTLLDTILLPLEAGHNWHFNMQLKPPYIDGEQQLFAIVDNNYKITEILESNNYKKATFMISNSEKPLLTLSVGSPVLSDKDTLNGVATLFNPTNVINGTLIIQIEDKQGTIIATLLENDVYDLDYGQQLENIFNWTPDNLFAGDFTLKGQFFNLQGDLLSTSQYPLSIVPSTQFQLTFRELPIQIEQESILELKLLVNYLSGNILVENAIIQWQVFDTNEVLVFSDEKDLTAMLPQYQGISTTSWNTEQLPLGNYRLRGILKTAEGEVKTEQPIMLVATNKIQKLSGSVELTTSQISLGEIIEIKYQVNYQGEEDLTNLPIKLQLVTANNLTELESIEQNINLNTLESQDFTQIWNSTELDFKNYLIILTGELEGESLLLASMPLTIIDSTPPIIDIKFPTEDSIQPKNITLDIKVLDAHSLITNVRLKENLDINSINWRSVGIGNAIGHYQQALFDLPEGRYSLVVEANDSWGNIGQQTRSFNVDRSAPTLTILTPSNHQSTKEDAVFLTGITEALAQVTLILDDQQQITQADNLGAFQFTIPLILGENQLMLTVTDAVNNTSNPIDWFIIKEAPEIIDLIPPTLVINSPNNHAITKESSILLIGTTEALAQVTLTISNQQQIAQADDSGEFQFTIPVILGENKLTLTATDEFNNTSDPVEWIIVREQLEIIDLTPPTLTIISPSNHAITNENSVLLIGTTEALAQVTLIVSNQQQITQADDLGKFEFTVPLILGNNTLILTATDASNNTSNPIKWIIVRERIEIIDLTPPTLTITSPSNHAIIKQEQVLLTGVTEAIAKVILIIDNQQQITQADDLGKFQFTVPLVLGNNKLTLTATDAFNNTSNPVEWSIVRERREIIDLTPPILTITSPSNHATTKKKSILLTGITEALAQIVLTVSNQQQIVQADDLGKFQFTIPLTFGDNKLILTATDAFNNTSDPVEWILVREQLEIIDLTPPTLTIISPSNHAITKENSVLLIGTTEALAQVTLIVSNQQQITQADDLGEFQFTVPVVLGNNKLILTATDASNNTSDPIEWIIVKEIFEIIDLTPPSLTIISPSNQAIIKREEVLLTGITEALAQVILTISNQQETTQADDLGKFQFTIPLVLGNNNLILTATDASNNTSTPVAWIIIREQQEVIDVTPPTLTIISPSNYAIIKREQVLLTGVTEALAQVTLTVSEQQQITQADDLGKFQFTIPLILGENKLTLTATDRFNNTSDPIEWVIVREKIRIIDLIAPTLTITSPSNHASIKWNQVLLTGITESLAQVILIIDNQQQITQADNLGQFEFTVSLILGNNKLTLTATDASNNTSDPVEWEIVREILEIIDITPPTLTIISPSNHAVTQESKALLIGTTEILAQVTLTISNQQQKTQADDLGKFQFIVPLILGNNNFTLTATDASNNTSNPVEWEIIRERLEIIDIISPTLTIISPSNHAVTIENSILLIGITEAFAQVTLTISNQQQKTQADDLGKFQFTVPLVLSNNNLTLIATDASNNASDSVEWEIIRERLELIDIIPPTLTIVSPSNHTVTIENSVLLIGITEAFAQVTLTISNQQQRAQADDLGKFQFTVPLVLSNNNLTLTATDASNNTSDPVEWEIIRERLEIIDIIPPTLTIVSPSNHAITIENSVLLIGITEAFAQVTLTISNQQQRVQADDLGKFQFTVPLVLGNNNLTLTATDASNNTSDSVEWIITRKNITVIDEPTNLNLIVLKPQNYAHTKTEKIILTGKTSALAHIILAMGQYKQTIYADTEGYFKFTVSLAIGSNNLILIATDTKNNVSKPVKLILMRDKLINPVLPQAIPSSTFISLTILMLLMMLCAFYFIFTSKKQKTIL